MHYTANENEFNNAFYLATQLICGSFFFGNFGKLYFVKTEFEHLCHCLQALFFNNITCLFELYTIFVFMGSFWPQL